VPVLYLLIAAALLAGPVAAQTVRGRVLDAGSGEPVAGAAVQVLDAGSRTVQRARAASDGTFTLRLRVGGSYRLRGDRAGYGPSTSGALEVGARDTVAVELRMAEQALTIDPLTVTARRGPRRVPALEHRGFYAREARGLGDFLHREDIRRGAPLRLSQALDRVVGTTLIQARSGDVIVFDRSWGTNVLQRPGDSLCPPRIYLDGTGVSGMTVDLVQPESVEAVEMYHGPSQIPAEYGGSTSSCGVILIWTRSGP
jgi:hypothetical protein